eukprot:11170449-Lingulodinium_polyedra.AAC.1
MAAFSKGLEAQEAQAAGGSGAGSSHDAPPAPGLPEEGGQELEELLSDFEALRRELVEMAGEGTQHFALSIRGGKWTAENKHVGGGATFWQQPSPGLRRSSCRPMPCRKVSAMPCPLTAWPILLSWPMPGSTGWSTS